MAWASPGFEPFQLDSEGVLLERRAAELVRFRFVGQIRGRDLLWVGVEDVQHCSVDVRLADQKQVVWLLGDLTAVLRLGARVESVVRHLAAH